MKGVKLKIVIINSDLLTENFQNLIKLKFPKTPTKYKIKFAYKIESLISKLVVLN